MEDCSRKNTDHRPKHVKPTAQFALGAPSIRGSGTPHLGIPGEPPAPASKTVTRVDAIFRDGPETIGTGHA